MCCPYEERDERENYEPCQDNTANERTKIWMHLSG